MSASPVRSMRTGTVKSAALAPGNTSWTVPASAAARPASSTRAAWPRRIRARSLCGTSARKTIEDASAIVRISWSSDTRSPRAAACDRTAPSDGARISARTSDFSASATALSPSALSAASFASRSISRAPASAASESRDTIAASRSPRRTWSPSETRSSTSVPANGGRTFCCASAAVLPGLVTRSGIVALTSGATTTLTAADSAGADFAASGFSAASGSAARRQPASANATSSKVRLTACSSARPPPARRGSAP